jgi:hypothetical protein
LMTFYFFFANIYNYILHVEDREKMWICNLCNQNITTIWTYWLL